MAESEDAERDREVISRLAGKPQLKFAFGLDPQQRFFSNSCHTTTTLLFFK